MKTYQLKYILTWMVKKGLEKSLPVIQVIRYALLLAKAGDSESLIVYMLFKTTYV